MALDAVAASGQEVDVVVRRARCPARGADADDDGDEQPGQADEPGDAWAERRPRNLNFASVSRVAGI